MAYKEDINTKAFASMELVKYSIVSAHYKFRPLMVPNSPQIISCVK